MFWSVSGCFPVPTGRWGHGMCSIDNRKAVLVGGQGSKLQMVKDSVWTLDMSLGKLNTIANYVSSKDTKPCT